MATEIEPAAANYDGPSSCFSQPTPPTDDCVEPQHLSEAPHSSSPEAQDFPSQPEEFVPRTKRPSDKRARKGPQLEDGNWRCPVCVNVNYPRRTVCNRCKARRDPASDHVVSQYMAKLRSLEAQDEWKTPRQLNPCSSSLSLTDQDPVYAKTGVSLGFLSTPEASPMTSPAVHAQSSSPGGLCPPTYSLASDESDARTSRRAMTPPPFPNFLMPYHYAATTVPAFESPFHVPAGQTTRPTSGIQPVVPTDTPDYPQMPASPMVLSGDDGNGQPFGLRQTTPHTSTSTEAASFSAGISSHTHSGQSVEVKAQDLIDRLVLDLTASGDPRPTETVVTVLHAARRILGEANGQGAGTSEKVVGSDGDPEGSKDCRIDTAVPIGLGGPHFSAPTMLAHPDEFKNPSSFLKIYGDPLCASSPPTSSHNPLKGHNGNWICHRCRNVNFPRRFRCNKCSEYRDDEGDHLVSEYAKEVYLQHHRAYKSLYSPSALPNGVAYDPGRQGGPEPREDIAGTPQHLQPVTPKPYMTIPRDSRGVRPPRSRRAPRGGREGRNN